MKTERAINPVWTGKHKTKILPGLSDCLLRFVPPTGGLGVVVDMACGEGTCAFRFAPRAKKVHAYDLSKRQIQHCHDALVSQGHTNVHAKLQDVQRVWPMRTSTVDIVTGVGALSNLDDPASALAQAARVLKAKGLLLLGDFCVPSPAHEVWGVLSSFRYGRRRPYLDYHQYTNLLSHAGFEIVKYQAIRWRYCLNDSVAALPPMLANAVLAAAQDVDVETKKLLRMQVRGARLLLENDCFALAAGRMGSDSKWLIDDTSGG